MPDEADAFLIFETLNDRGADLTTADLLKNYLFGKSSTELDVVRDRWISAVSTIQTVADDQLFTTFLRHFWSSLYGITRERELYAAIKRRISDKKSAVEFAERLSVEARNYAALRSPSHERWDELGELPRENLQTLNRLELEQVRPLLLAVVQHFQEKELKIALAYLVSWNFRSLITGTSGGGVFESAFCQASVKVRKGDLKTTKELFAELSAIIPSDNAFENALRTAVVPKAKLARYILHAIERYRRGTGSPEMISNTDEESVNLEHILPKNAKEADWPQFSADDRSSFVHRLGNMALLDAAKNRKIGNKPWETKKPILSSSKLQIAQEAGSADAWLTTSIDFTQSKFASEAVKIWRRQPVE